MAIQTKAWYETAYLSISKIGGTETEYRMKTTSFNHGGGNFDFEGIEVFGGKLARIGATEDVELTFDVIPVSANEFDKLFYGSTASSEPYNITSSLTKDKFRITILWTDQTGVTGATQAIDTSSEAYRRVYANFYMTGFEPSFDAGDYLKATLHFKGPVVDETGGGNILIQSCDTTSALPALSSYDTSNKW